MHETDNKKLLQEVLTKYIKQFAAYLKERLPEECKTIYPDFRDDEEGYAKSDTMLAIDLIASEFIGQQISK